MGLSSPPSPANLTLTKRKVVLPEGLSGHHQIPHHGDPWHQWEGFVVILVLLHVAVLLFYAWILYQDKKKEKKPASRSGAEGRRGPASPHSSRYSAGAGLPLKTEWRTPKDILASYQKQRIGKT